MPALTARVAPETTQLRVLYTDTPGGVPDVVLATVPAAVHVAEAEYVAGTALGLATVALTALQAVSGRRLALVAVGAGGLASPLSNVVTVGAPADPPAAGVVTFGGEPVTYDGEPVTYTA